MPEQITSRKNEQVRYAARLGASAGERRKEQKFLAEGARLCCDAARSGISVSSLFYTEQALIRYGSYLSEVMEKADKCYEISPHVAELLSDTKASQGVFCVCSMPAARKGGAFRLETSCHYVALENIQDPGNLGAILRTAEALGIGGVILSGEGCDPYSPKVLRASMGAVFRVPLFPVQNMAKACLQLKQDGFDLYAAVPDGNAERITDITFEKPGVILVGNEGNGLSLETVKACGRCVTIPMAGRAESLNAAASAAILMWEQMKGARGGSRDDG